MDGAALDDLGEALSLGFVEGAVDGHVRAHSLDHAAALVVTLLAVAGVDAVVVQWAVGPGQRPAWDVSCPQQIRPRYTEDEIQPVIEKLQRRIAELETLVDAEAS